MLIRWTYRITYSSDLRPTSDVLRAVGVHVSDCLWLAASKQGTLLVWLDGRRGPLTKSDR